MDNVIEFINNFKRDFDANYLEHVFNNGNCYHFAVILKDLFGGVYVMICLINTLSR